jgi:hypothetical protein
MDELRRLLTQRLDSVSGLLAMVISDRDGVPVIKASIDQSNAIENCFRLTNFEPSFFLCET